MSSRTHNYKNSEKAIRMSNSTTSESESVTGIPVDDVDLGIGVSSGIEDFEEDQQQAQEPNYQYYYLNPNQNHTAQTTESTIHTTTSPTAIPIPTPPTLSPTKSVSKMKKFNETGETNILVKLGALAWIAAIVAWLYVHHQYEEERARRLERRRERRREEAKKKKMLDPNLRRSVIAKCVSTRIMKEEDLRGFAAPSRSNDDSKNDHDKSDANFDSYYDSAGNHFSECPVCLDPFLPGEALSWSKSFNCHHIFHSGCINPWIMTSDECPCCRAPFFRESDFIEAMKGGKDDSFGGVGVEGERQTRMRAETFTSYSECSGVDEDYITDDDMMDHGGKGGSFRVVNGLIEFVKILSPSKNTTSGEDIDIRDNSGDIYGPDIDEEQHPIHGDAGLNFPTVEMITMVTQSNNHDDIQDDTDNNTSGMYHEDQYEHKHRNNNKKKRKKKRLNKKRYNSLSNTGSDSSDHDDDMDDMDSSHYDQHFRIDEDDEGQFEQFDDNQGVESQV